MLDSHEAVTTGGITEICGRRNGTTALMFRTLDSTLLVGLSFARGRSEILSLSLTQALDDKGDVDLAIPEEFTGEVLPARVEHHADGRVWFTVFEPSRDHVRMCIHLRPPDCLQLAEMLLYCAVVP